jgi:hypothetical protein
MIKKGLLEKIGTALVFGHVVVGNAVVQSPLIAFGVLDGCRKLLSTGKSRQSYQT